MQGAAEEVPLVQREHLPPWRHHPEEEACELAPPLRPVAYGRLLGLRRGLVVLLARARRGWRMSPYRERHRHRRRSRRDDRGKPPDVLLVPLHGWRAQKRIPACQICRRRGVLALPGYPHHRLRVRAQCHRQHHHHPRCHRQLHWHPRPGRRGCGCAQGARESLVRPWHDISDIRCQTTRATRAHARANAQHSRQHAHGWRTRATQQTSRASVAHTHAQHSTRTYFSIVSADTLFPLSSLISCRPMLSRAKSIISSYIPGTSSRSLSFFFIRVARTQRSIHATSATETSILLDAKQ